MIPSQPARADHVVSRSDGEVSTSEDRRGVAGGTRGRSLIAISCFLALTTGFQQAPVDSVPGVDCRFDEDRLAQPLPFARK